MTGGGEVSDRDSRLTVTAGWEARQMQMHISLCTVGFYVSPID